MSTDSPTTVTKYPESFGLLENFKPAGFGTTNIPEGEMPFDPGTPEYDAELAHKRALWQRRFFFLFDVPLPTEDSWGKCVMLVPDANFETAIKYDWPDQLKTARNFSITGDGIAEAVPFNGTDNVVLQLRNLVAEKLKTPRTITFNGSDALGSFVFDGSQNVSVALNILQASKWRNQRTVTFIGADATGLFSIDGTQNVNVTLTVHHATRADSAASADHATSADTAGSAGSSGSASGLAAGALTVTLVGDVTGSGTNNAFGVIEIETTGGGGGGGGGGTGANGSATLGNSTQQWGRVITDANGAANITFATPYLTAAGYSIVPYVEDALLGTGEGVRITVSSRSTGGCTVTAIAIPGMTPLSGARVNYIVVGQTSST